MSDERQELEQLLGALETWCPIKGSAHRLKIYDSILNLFDRRVPKRWCRLAGPGRGDCEHYVGLPDTLDETTTDEYGIPHGWCDYCWLSHQLAEAHAALREAGYIDKEQNDE